MPVGAGLPKASWLLAEEGGVEVGEPAEADPDTVAAEVMVACRETGVVEVFEDEEPTRAVEFRRRDSAGDAGGAGAAQAVVLVPGEFDLVGAELALVGAVGRPAAGVVGL